MSCARLGCLAVFKVTARDQGHYKGPSGAFITYCNISCFFDMNPVALRKAKIEYNFGLSECSRVKRKGIVLSEEIKIMFFFAIFLKFFLTIKSRYTHSEKIKVFKNKSFQPTCTYPNSFQSVT